MEALLMKLIALQKDLYIHMKIIESFRGRFIQDYFGNNAKRINNMKPKRLKASIMMVFIVDMFAA